MPPWRDGRMMDVAAAAIEVDVAAIGIEAAEVVVLVAIEAAAVDLTVDRAPMLLLPRLLPHPRKTTRRRALDSARDDS